MFPLTAEQFEALRAIGKTVIYSETLDESSPPGDGWSFWSHRSDVNGVVAVWRKIVTLDEAMQMPH